jgi:hypothetical protein
MGGKGGKKFGPRRKGCAKFKPGPNKLGKPRRWPPRKVAAKKVAKKKVAAKKVANQNDDDQVDTGESNAPAAENPTDDANIVLDEHDNDDYSFVQVANQNDDDQIDTGESNAPAAENPNDAVQVEAVEPTRSCRSQEGCGKIFCFVCYPE